MNRVLVIFLIMVGATVGCKNDDLLTNCGPKPTEVIIQQFVQADGILRQYPSSTIFYIELNKCIDCRTVHTVPVGLTAPASPCNLPESFRKDGLPISFSGKLRVDTTFNYSAIDISGIPLELTSIKRR